MFPTCESTGLQEKTGLLSMKVALPFYLGLRPKPTDHKTDGDKESANYNLTELRWSLMVSSSVTLVSLRQSTEKKKKPVSEKSEVP